MISKIHHLGLTVESLSEARDFFIQFLGWKIIKENPDYPSFFVKGGETILTIWKAQVDSPIQFNRKFNLGLHHLALLVETKEELIDLHEKFESSKYIVEFGPRPNGENLHFMLEGPSKIRIEFITLKEVL